MLYFKEESLKITMLRQIRYASDIFLTLNTACFPCLSTVLSLEFLTVTLPRATRIYQKWTAQMLTYLYTFAVMIYRCVVHVRVHGAWYACAYRRKHRCETRAAENSIASSTTRPCGVVGPGGDDGTRAVIYGELRVPLVRLHRP